MSKEKLTGRVTIPTDVDVCARDIRISETLGSRCNP